MPPDVTADPSSPILETTTRNGLTFSYRLGTVDELVLDDEYQGPRFGGADGADSRVILDAGAHIGAFALAAAAANPTARVVAVEAAAATHRLLAANVAANQLGNVEPVRLALSGTDGEARLLHAAWNWGHSLEAALVAPDASGETVRTCTLARLLDELGIDDLSYLKMNIEGAEYATLLAAGVDTLRRVERMAVELHPLADHSVDALAEHVRAAGFDVQVDRDGADGATFLGWLRAERREPPA